MNERPLRSLARALMGFLSRARRTAYVFLPIRRNSRPRPGRRRRLLRAELIAFPSDLLIRVAAVAVHESFGIRDRCRIERVDDSRARGEPVESFFLFLF